MTIPNSVATIGRDAFRWCRDLKTVTIGNGLKKIDNETFMGCESLSYVKIGDSVTYIGQKAFAYCPLPSVTIPNSVTTIGKHAFFQCRLSTVTIGNGLASIGEYAFGNTIRALSLDCKKIDAWFKDYSNINEIRLGESVTTINKEAFRGCSGLTSLTIGNSVESIGDYAFNGCESLIFVTIPNSVSTMGKSAFEDCSGLTSLTIGNGISSIGQSAFRNCKKLSNLSLNCKNVGSWFKSMSSIKEIVMGNEVNTIDNSAFQGCSGLTSLIIGNSVTSIGENAFGGCNSLTTLTLNFKKIGTWFSKMSSIKVIVMGDDVNTIDNSAFQGCSGLESLKIGNGVMSIGNDAFGGCSDLTSVTIPNSVLIIGLNSFLNCFNLTTLIIGNSVTTIGNSAFQGCTGLKSIFSLNITPPTISNSTFDNTTTINAKLYVPQGYKAIYSQSNNWKEFKKIEELDETNTLPEYSLSYMVDGEEYKTYKLMEGDVITPEPEPTKDGYAFSGWSEIPYIMPAHDVTIYGFFNPSDFVDLGLSSRTLWATKNIGAEVPVEYGQYFAWGEIAPKNNYDWSTYKFGRVSNFTKYNSIDGLTVLELEDDAAYMILGKNWRMPTYEQGNELINECSWESTTINGISGYIITGPNGNSIFMPRGGLCIDEYGPLDENNGVYWSSTLLTGGSDVAMGLDFETFFSPVMSATERYWGLNIRPIYVGEGSNIIINKERNLNQDDYYNLQGQRVLFPKNGIYIKNGKKVFVK